jgi:hypothetical protein
MNFEAHTLVQLLQDHDEIAVGSFGSIVEVCNDDYEVEFFSEGKIVRILVPASSLVAAEPMEDRCS